ncbi:hypothetical protein KAW44_04285 [Candidatus Bipolaricaulota bacterium]|nr:hypothetical protein [Candidatus Bipolaricaulota bacterium]
MNRISWIFIVAIIGLMLIMGMFAIHSGVIAVAEESSQTQSETIPVVPSWVSSAEQRALVAGNTRFALDLYRILIPGFEFRSSFELSSALKDLGMTDAFILGRANFRGMALTRELFLGDLYHQTVVSVDENGTFAVAATAADMVAPDVPTVRLNRPFIFLIRDIETGTILFIGQVLNASAG